ncbi:MAG: serine protease [Vicinamibacterales bacterium]
MVRVLIATLLVAVLGPAGPTSAQTEADLRNAFEGKSLAPKRDMPGTKEGVEINIQGKPPVNTADWTRDLRRYGVAIEAGRPALITLIKVKGKVIEFHFEGGGASPSTCRSQAAVATKSTRELELELKAQKTSDERMEQDKLIQDRELRDATAKKENDAVIQACTERAATERKNGGSRFNIRYPANPTATDLTPDAFRKALADFIDFAPGSATTTLAQASIPSEAEAQAKRLVVMIKGKLDGEDTIGAGVLFGAGQDRLYVATANHVVRRGPGEATDVMVMLQWLPGEWVPARVLASVDAKADLAVLVVPGLRDLSFESAWFAEGRLGGVPQRGDEVNFLGYGNGEAWHSLAKPDAVSAPASESIRFQSAFLAQGDSGGALVNAQWQIIGLNLSDQQGGGAAIPIARVLARAREWGYPVDIR